MQSWHERWIRSSFCKCLPLPSPKNRKTPTWLQDKRSVQQMPVKAVCAGTWTMSRMLRRLQSALLVSTTQSTRDSAETVQRCRRSLQRVTSHVDAIACLMLSANAGSSQANPFACIASGIAALWGPAHGGANEVRRPCCILPCRPSRLPTARLRQSLAHAALLRQTPKGRRAPISKNRCL